MGKNKQQEDFRWLEENFFTSEETSQILGISKQALASLVKRNKMPCVKKGKTMLFHRLDIEKRMSEQMQLRDKYRPYERF
ncbi:MULTISPECIES: helix-turn-helix domain-containing protein [Listeria]|uniref:helix-turn-helix domain-containing protein n=1 Tax=Listeria TaxID=1637 RepID=UPI000C07EAD4|nr:MULTISPECIES: helix-turn-helix domain-containing protein [Listeria]